MFFGALVLYFSEERTTPSLSTLTRRIHEVMQLATNLDRARMPGFRPQWQRAVNPKP